MDRLACVDVPCLPVQMLCRRPGWASRPVAWIDREAANGRLLEVNERAEQAGIRSGMRYARALALNAQLRAAPLADEVVATQVTELAMRLQELSPEVEASVEIPGRFWLNGTGLRRLFGTPAVWARTIQSALQEAGFVASVVVGFERFATGALVSVRPGLRILRDPAEEEAALADLPVEGVIMSAGTRETLKKLGVRRISELDALPMAGRISRFGVEATLPERRRRFSPMPLREPLRAAYFYGDEAVSDEAILLATATELLTQMLPQLTERDRHIAALHLRLELENRAVQELTVEPAEPTRDTTQVLQLLALRLARETLACGVVEMRLAVDDARADERQPSLFAVRDLDAANHALTELRARFGTEAVVYAELRDAWLPHAQVVWRPLKHLTQPAPAAQYKPRLVRRLLAKPRVLPGHAPDRPPLRNLQRQYGPFQLDGQWWATPVDQRHYYADCADGELAWLSYEPEPRRWSLIGYVD